MCTKILTKTLALFLFALIASCGPGATFTTPQPVQTKDLPILPKNLYGKYINLADSSTVLITDNSIERHFDGFNKIHRNDLDSTLQLQGNKIINLVTKEQTFVKLDGDSLIVPYHYIDTLLKIDNSKYIVRKYKGYYFLNRRFPENSWEVKKLQLKRGKLMISNINTQADIDQLKQITGSAQDTVPYIFNLTKKDFKKFIKTDGFKLIDTFLLIDKSEYLIKKQNSF